MEVEVPATAVKREEDEPGFEPLSPTTPRDHASSTSVTATTSTTSILNEHLAASDFFQRICLVELEEESVNGTYTILWPAIRYCSIGKLQEAVKNDVKVPAKDLALLQAKNLKWGRDGDRGIAYLLGRKKFKQSLIALRSEDMVHDFYSRIYEIKDKDGYKGDVSFQNAYAVVMKRTNTKELDSESEDDSVTVALSSPPSPLDTVKTRTSPLPKSDSKYDCITVAPSSPTTALDEGKTQTSRLSTSAEKKKRVGKEENIARKKKKIMNADKTSKPRAKTPFPIVTPGPLKSVDEYISERVSSPGDSYKIMTNSNAWKLLESKFGFTHQNGSYYHSSKGDTVFAASITHLRNDLCARGLPKATASLLEQERLDIARWVRYAHVFGLADGQHINTDNLGKPIEKFKSGWKILADNFGCKYSCGNYIVPDLSSGKVVKYARDIDLGRAFAQFGVKCIPDDVPEKTLSKKDRLSLEIFFATTLFKILNTFERIQNNENCTNDNTPKTRSRTKRNSI